MLSPQEHAARDTAQKTLNDLCNRFGAGFVLACVGMKIKDGNSRFGTTYDERQRVTDWAHEMLDEGLQS